MPQEPVGSQPVSPNASPPVGRPVIGSRLLTIEHRAWQLLGASIGPVRSTVLRLTVTLGVDCVVERVDGQPLGDLAEQFREQIAAARADLEERLRRGGTATWKRQTGALPPAAAPPVAIPVPVAAPVAPPVAEPVPDRIDVPPAETNKKNVTSSVFRCERQVITDRITRLRKETPAVPSAAEAEEAALAARRIEQQRARERLAEIRTQYWETQREPQPDNLLPSPAPPGVEVEAPKRQHTSSVFRVDREAITDRIERLKRKADVPPPIAEPVEEQAPIAWPKDVK